MSFCNDGWQWYNIQREIENGTTISTNHIISLLDNITKILKKKIKLFDVKWYPKITFLKYNPKPKINFSVVVLE